MPIVTPDVTNSAYRETDIYDSYGQKYSGIADIFFGYSTKQTRISATEATLATEMGAGIMEEIVAGQVQDGYIPLMEKVRDYIKAFNTSPLPVVIDNSLRFQVHPETAYFLKTICDKLSVSVSRPKVSRVPGFKGSRD